MASGAKTDAQAEDSFRLVFDAMPDAAILVDAEGIVVHANRAAESRFRRSHAELAGIPLTEVTSGGSPEEVGCRTVPVRGVDGGWTLHVFNDVQPGKRRDRTASRLEAIVESSDDAIVTTDLEGKVLGWNKGAARIFGYSAEEMVGCPFARLIPEDRREEGIRILAKIRNGEHVRHFETRRQTKDGTLLDISVSVSPIVDESGVLVGTARILRDISVHKAHEREIERLSRLYGALSQVNQAIVWSGTREELFRRVCAVLVGHGGFRMAWVGWHDEESRRILPVAHSGDSTAHLAGLDISSDDCPNGRGPVGRAFREKRPFVCNELLNEPSIQPWRDRIEQSGFQSNAVFPIRRTGQVCGTLSVYSDEPFFFQDKEVALLAEAAGDVSFALDNLDREAARRRAEEAVRRERDFSEVVLTSLPGVFYVYDEEGRFRRWNRNFEHVTGYSAAEIATMHPLDFYAGSDKELLAARIREVFEKGESSVEAGFVAKDGCATPYFFTGVRAEFDGRSCLVGVGIDISARKRAEEARLEIEARYHTLFDYAPDGIVIADAQSHYLDANASICRMLGYAREELVGLHASDIVVPDEIAHIDPALGAIQSQSNYHREWRFRRKDGTTFAADVIGTMMPDGTLLGMIRDITDRKEAEQALRELNETLELKVADRTKELEALNRELESFCYSVSHDLRAPLRGIAGFTEILAETCGPGLDETSRRYFDRVLAATARMGDLIDDLLNLSRVSRDEFRRERVDLEALAGQVVGELRASAPDRPVEVLIDGPLETEGDARLLRVMLENLLGNAWKFTSKTPEARIEFGVDGDGNEGAFFIRDNGAGFDMRYAGKLFAPFQRLHGMQDFPGTGIGLATVQRIIHRHGGRIWAEGKVGEGATFRFTLRPL